MPRRLLTVLLTVLLRRLGVEVTTVVVVVATVMVLGGFLFKAPCLDPWTGQ